MPIEHKLARQQHHPLILFLTRTRIIRDSSRLQLHTMATIITHRQRTRGRGRPRLQPIAQGAMEPQRSLRTAIETYLQPRQHNQHLRMPTHKQIGRLGIMLLVSFFFIDYQDGRSSWSFSFLLRNSIPTTISIHSIHRPTHFKLAVYLPCIARNFKILDTISRCSDS